MSFSIAREFRQALARRELASVFQPIRRLDDGAALGVEALMRWHHGERGVIRPKVFIPASERDGSIIAPGAWILQQAVEALAGWRAARRDLGGIYVAVNLSPVQLDSPRLVETMSAHLAEHGLSPSDLHLEVTESVPLADTRAPEQLALLRGAGFRLSIDDFGAGFTSLSHLHRMAFDTMKIDRSFIADLPDHRQARIIVESLVRLASDLDMAVIAEGVETEAQRRALLDIGCEVGQGYLLGDPVAAEEIPGVL